MPANKASRKRAKAKKPRIPKLHRPKKESTKTITTRLYKTWAAIGHARSNGRCEVCGATGKIDAHHVQPRQICSGLRFDPHNCVCLCSSHHKYGHRSAHKGMLWFADWFKTNRPDDYEYVMRNLDRELDCKDRSKLYVVENDLHTRYSDAVAPLTTYRVVGYDKKLNKVESVVDAYNNRSAEFLFWSSWPKSEIPLKGIQKTEELKVEHFRNLPDLTTDDIFSRLTLDQFSDYLTKGFSGQKATDDTMSRIRAMFDRWCDAHEVDPEDYALYKDKDGQIRFMRVEDELAATKMTRRTLHEPSPAVVWCEQLDSAKKEQETK